MEHSGSTRRTTSNGTTVASRGGYPLHPLTDPGFELPRADDAHPEPKIAQGSSELVLGVAAEYIDAKTPLELRKRAIAGFRSGAVRVLCNCMIFVEGFEYVSVRSHRILWLRHSVLDRRRKQEYIPYHANSVSKLS